MDVGALRRVIKYCGRWQRLRGRVENPPEGDGEPDGRFPPAPLPIEAIASVVSSRNRQALEMTIETRFERLARPVSWDRNRDVAGLAMPQIGTQKSVRWHLPLRKALKTQAEERCPSG